MSWLIYLLYDVAGEPDYVGSTNSIKRRLKEHKRVLGFRPEYKILECGEDIRERLKTEGKWIAHWKGLGAKLRNRHEFAYGFVRVTESTRLRLSASLRGKKKPPGFGDRMSAATKGVPKNWTDEGRARSAKTRFKKGQSTWLAKTEAQKADHREKARRNWDGISKEVRSAKATARNLSAWQRRSKGERTEVANKIVATRRRNHSPEEISKIYRDKQLRTIEQNPEIREQFSRRVKGWWASLTPEAKAEYVARRAVAIKKAKDEKRAHNRLADPQLSFL